MSGEKDIQKLLQGLNPQLNEGEYVFVQVDPTASIDIEVVLGFFREKEGKTLILKRDMADQLGLSYEFVGAWISLEIHSALDAVGLTAAFSNALAEHGISCNVIAGYYHDHVFVPYAEREEAMAILNELATRSFKD